MLLEELINTKSRSKTVGKLHTPNSNDTIGSGMYATVKDVKNDPHMVKKTFRRPIHNLDDHDPYWAYIKWIAHDGMANKNPYFPRIYNITNLKDADAKELRRAKMEKLQSIDDINIDLLYPVYQRMAGKEFKSDNNFDDKDDDDDDSLIKDYIIYQLKNDLDWRVDDDAESSYKEAINYIKKLKHALGAKLDIHDRNIMFRIGSNGAQLVITDPFFGIYLEKEPDESVEQGKKDDALLMALWN